MTHDRIVVRDCSSFAGLPPDRFIRVAVRDATDNARLVSALAMALGNRSGQCRKNGKR
jgi:histidinol-phosphate/aromatic aminotransferase/cobyric acid decarboxylase-like protein